MSDLICPQCGNTEHWENVDNGFVCQCCETYCPDNPQVATEMADSELQSETIKLKRKDLQTQVMELRTQIILLEQQVEALRAEREDLNNAIDTQIGVWRNVNERLAALEAQAAPAPEYAPGYRETMYDGDLLVIYGMADNHNSTPNIYFIHDRVRNRYSLHGYDGERPITIDDITPQQLRHLIGAAMAVLKRMEMGGE